MKQSWSARLGVATLLLTSIAAMANFKHLTRHRPEKTNRPVRVLLIGSIKNPIGPEDISSMALYHIHYNLWDTLLAPEKNSTGLAEKFSVSNDFLEYTLSLDPTARFSNGRHITSADIKFSLNRLMKKEELGEGLVNARTLIHDISTPDDHTVIIKLNEPTPAFESLLGIAEFGIVPRESCDDSGNITNFSITSGAYTIDHVDESAQKVTLRVNKYYRQYRKNSPENVELSFTRDDKRLIQDILNLRTDFVQLIGTSPEEVKAALRDHPDLDFEYTKPSISTTLIPRISELSPPQRKYLAALFQNEFHFLHGEPVIEDRSHQLLPPSTIGSLEESQIPNISAPKVPLPSPLVIKTFSAGHEMSEHVTKFFHSQGIEVEFIPYNSTKAAHIDARSQGMNLDHPEIELQLCILSPYAWISASAETKEKIKKAFGMNDDIERAKIVQQVGKELLQEGNVIPLTIRSYIHIYNKNKLNVTGVTAYDGDLPLYRMTVVGEGQ